MAQKYGTMSTVNILRKSIIGFVKGIFGLNQNAADFFALSECGRYSLAATYLTNCINILLKIFKCQTTDTQDNAILCLYII